MAASALLVAACGSTGGRSASVLRPPSPVYVSVYINNARVSVSPGSVGAGPVVFVVANQASQAEALAISHAGGGAQPLASTAPINPQGTTQVTVDIKPGRYTVATAPRGATEAQIAQPSGIRAASLHIGRRRPHSSNQVMQP